MSATDPVDTSKMTMQERDALIVDMRRRGMTYVDIGKLMHLTDVRCLQIVQRERAKAAAAVPA